MPRSSEPRGPVVPVIGGGPAGMSCALSLHNYGLFPLIIEKESALGGMARMSPYPNEWLLGQRGKTGRENAADFAAHIRELGVESRPGLTPQRLRRQEQHWRLDLAGEPAARSLSAPAIVIATGTRFAGEEWLDGVANARRMMAAGRLHLGATAVGEQGADLGSHVAVIGGGEIEADRVVLLFGYRPNTDQPWLVALAPATDALGYLVIDGNMETSCRGVFAAGDVANPAHPCIATAIASGAVAARHIAKRLAHERAAAP